MLNSCRWVYKIKTYKPDSRHPSTTCVDLLPSLRWCSRTHFISRCSIIPIYFFILPYVACSPDTTSTAVLNIKFILTLTCRRRRSLTSHQRTKHRTMKHECEEWKELLFPSFFCILFAILILLEICYKLGVYYILTVCEYHTQTQTLTK